MLSPACPAGRSVSAVASEDVSGAARRADAEILGEEAPAAVRQDPPGAAVGAAGGRGLRPHPEFVLSDDGAVAFHPAVAGRSGAGGDAEEATAAFALRTRGRSAEEQSGRASCRARVGQYV